VRLCLVALVVAAFAAGSAACGSSSPGAAPGTIRVVAAENFYADIARQIGGSHVAVTSLLSDPNADPHLHDATASEAARVSGARLVIKNGLGYDQFVDDMLDSTAGDKRDVLTVADVLDVHGDTANPHLWYDVPRMPQVARAIANELSAIDPANRRDYEANLAKFDASLQPLIHAIEQIQQQHPGAPVAYTERVPGYLLHAAGLTVASPPGFARAIEDGTEPSARDTQAMNTLLEQRGARVLLYNAQATSPITQNVRDLAAQRGIPVVAVTETMPKGSTYQRWQLDQIEELRAALGRNP
jgi:zinc/manganese transport system substrate-binding protein